VGVGRPYTLTFYVSHAFSGPKSVGDVKPLHIDFLCLIQTKLINGITDMFPRFSGPKSVGVIDHKNVSRLGHQTDIIAFVNLNDLNQMGFDKTIGFDQSV